MTQSLKFTKYLYINDSIQYSLVVTIILNNIDIILKGKS